MFQSELKLPTPQGHRTQAIPISLLLLSPVFFFVRLPIIQKFLYVLYGDSITRFSEASEETARIGASTRKFQHPNSKPYRWLVISMF